MSKLDFCNFKKLQKQTLVIWNPHHELHISQFFALKYRENFLSAFSCQKYVFLPQFVGNFCPELEIHPDCLIYFKFPQKIHKIAPSIHNTKNSNF